MPIEPAPDVRISHIGYDRKHTSAEDVNSYFPLERMKEAANDGRIGHLNERFYGVPTLRSQRMTTERDAPEVLALCREDRIDARCLSRLTGVPPDRESGPRTSKRTASRR